MPRRVKLVPSPEGARNYIIIFCFLVISTVPVFPARSAGFGSGISKQQQHHRRCLRGGFSRDVGRPVTQWASWEVFFLEIWGGLWRNGRFARESAHTQGLGSIVVVVVENWETVFSWKVIKNTRYFLGDTWKLTRSYKPPIFYIDFSQGFRKS